MKVFVTNSSAYHRYVMTPQGTKYSFFGGDTRRPVFVKNAQDIKWFESNSEFTEVTEMNSEEIKQAEENEKAGEKMVEKGDVEKPDEETKDERPLKTLSTKELKEKAEELGVSIEGKPSKRMLIGLIQNYLSTTS